jgi:creatinine amidohydrolase
VVVLVPAATIEDHGLHLPVDTDVVIAEAICKSTAERMMNEVLLLPTITYGFSPHHIDGPGTITVKWDTFVECVQQIVSSLVYHGFFKILILNAHGSNEPVLDLAARLVNVENPDAQCAMTSWWNLKRVQETVAAFRESEWTGHACELETSLYLAIDPSLVKRSDFLKDINPHMSAHFWSDLVGQAPHGYANAVRLTEYWSTVSETGTWGDPTVASAEKGQMILEAAVAELHQIVRELSARPVRPRRPHQNLDVQERNRNHSGALPRFTV